MRAGAHDSGLLTPARRKQIRLELVNQLPLVLRDSAVLRVHSELVNTISTLPEDAFRNKVAELDRANIAGIYNEKNRLLRQYLATFQCLSGPVAEAAAPPAQARAKLPNRYVTFDEFCDGMDLSADTRARCRIAWFEGGDMQTVSVKLGNILGTERLMRYLRTLDHQHYAVKLLQPDEAAPRRWQDAETAGLLLSLHQ
tara:strand:- start:945 stop:1538 length:594 start_codon:yes stop_codon:yes gene_type:complete